METRCPHCAKTVTIPDDKAGEMAQCPACDNVFHVPVPDHFPKCCRNCRYPLEPGAKFCVNCGFNMETGELLETRVATEEDDYGPARRFLVWLYDSLPGLFNPITLVMFFASIGATVFLLFIGLFIMSLGAFLSGIAVAAAGLMTYAQGLAFLATGRLEHLKTAFMNMEGRSWNAFVTLFFIPPAFVVIAMIVVAKYGG